MKKILLLSAAACMFSFVHAEDSIESSGGHGFYVGGGLVLSNSGERVDYQENFNAQGQYAPLAKYTETDTMKTDIGGTLLVGYQRVLHDNPVCLGLELGSDFARSRADRQSDKTAASGVARTYNLTTTRGGISPFIAFRAGYISHEYKTMIYLKAGASYVSSNEHYHEFLTGVHSDAFSGSVKLRTWMPLIAVGIEKAVAKDLTGRLECEYRFSKSKDKKQGLGDHTKFTQKDTLNIRALATYNVKI